MSEITFKNGQPIPPKRKKKHVFAKIFWPLFSIFVLLPLVLVGLFFGLFYDSTHTPIKYRDNYPNQEVFNDIITHSLDNTTTDHQMQVRLTEDALNQLFYNVMHPDEAEQNIPFVNNLYIKITDSNYVFGVEVDLYGFFKTRVFLTTKLTLTEEDIIFKVTNIQIGRVAGLDNLAKFILERVNLPDINQIFHDRGIHMDLDLKKLILKYPKENLIEDLGNSLGETLSGYLILLKEVILNDQLTTILPNHDKALEVDINLENMRPTSATYNIENYVMPDGYLNTILPNSMNKVKTYLESNVIAPDDAQAVANYYVSGYQYIDDQQKAKVNPYLEAHTIEEATDTYVYEIPNYENLATIAGAQLSHYPAGSSYYEVMYTTNQIDRALSQTTAIGETILFKSKDEEGNYTVNYIALDRVTNVIDAENDAFFLTLSMNFNGYDVGLSLKTTMDTETNVFGEVHFEILDMYVGDVSLSADAKSYFMEIVTKSIQEGAFNDVVTLVNEGETIYLKINLLSVLNSHNIYEEDGYVTSYELLPQTATEPGRVKFICQK